ncbi:putative ABC transporter ATP-binding protein YbhF [Planctomycetes bacterium MalM25]|nr:putative ABC transporter ATP-binding protein YbhF [Planctomycetes bacterium MalM25]
MGVLAPRNAGPDGKSLRTPKASAGPPIELRRLHRWFGPTHAVADVSFTVEPGEVFGYIGPNGAGKTTSMRILSTLDEPSAGDAFVDGFSVIEDPDRVRARLGFMPDYFGTYQNVSVREYLDFFARAYGLRGKERLGSLAYAMDFTGLDKLADKPIDGLSKGMKQRLCLGRTMIHDPSVMVLDEPAAGLDPRARIELREMISRLAEVGKAVLISSHILTELAEICDRVAIIEQGSLVAVGTVDEISSRVEEEISVRLRVLEQDDRGQASAERWLAQREHVDRVAGTKEGLSFVLSVEPDQRDSALSRLLADLVAAGFGVVEFTSRGKTLEDVFLHVTEGRVQ